MLRCLHRHEFSAGTLAVFGLRKPQDRKDRQQCSICGKIVQRFQQCPAGLIVAKRRKPDNKEPSCIKLRRPIPQLINIAAAKDGRLIESRELRDARNVHLGRDIGRGFNRLRRVRQAVKRSLKKIAVGDRCDDATTDAVAEEIPGVSWLLVNHRTSRRRDAPFLHGAKAPRRAVKLLAHARASDACCKGKRAETILEASFPPPVRASGRGSIWRLRTGLRSGGSGMFLILQIKIDRLPCNTEKPRHVRTTDIEFFVCHAREFRFWSVLRGSRCGSEGLPSRVCMIAWATLPGSTSCLDNAPFRRAARAMVSMSAPDSPAERAARMADVPLSSLSVYRKCCHISCRTARSGNCISILYGNRLQIAVQQVRMIRGSDDDS